MYLFFKLVHVVAAIAWLGAGLAFQVMNMRTRRSGDASASAWLAEQGQWFGRRYFSLAAITTLVAGIVMVVVSDGIGFGDLWITIGFAGILASILIGAIAISRTTDRLAEVLATEGPTSGTASGLQRRLDTLGWIDMTIVFGVVAVMVYKPG